MKTRFRPLALLPLLLVAAVPAARADSADLATPEKLGTVHFEVKGNPAARDRTVLGVKLLHHMMYPEADDAFAQAIAADPACALAYCGRAMTLIHPLWPDTVSDADRKKGAALLQQGLALPELTARERGYLEAMDRFFNASVPGDYPARLKELDVAWWALADKFPDDTDAAAFSALYHLAPARFLPKDKTHRIQFAALTRLQEVARRIPDHPGAQHYKIHAYDFPQLADQALEVCDSYGGIAPEVPHALHMPTHIYIRRGMWAESIAFNRRSAEAGRRLAEKAGTMNSHYPHALDYMTYAYLQRGQFHEAEAVRAKLAALQGPYAPGALAQIAFASAATPARCALERQAWAEAAALPVHGLADFPWSKSYLHCDSITYFARALGAARSGQLDAARTDLAQLERVARELTEAKAVPYWIAQANTQVLTVRAWLLVADKDLPAALGLMREAAALEMTADKEAVTPGEVLPAGDLLGEMLLLANQPAEALNAFASVLTASPNRLNSLYGAGLAAERAGLAAEAKRYFEQVAAVATDADPAIARVMEARSKIAHKTAGL